MAFGVVLPGAILVATLMPMLLFHSRLPDQLATGLNWSGRLISSSPLTELWISAIAIGMLAPLRMVAANRTTPDASGFAHRR